MIFSIYLQKFLLIVLVCSTFFRFGHSYRTHKVIQGSEKPGEHCEVDGVWGSCEEVYHCRSHGGTLRKTKGIRLCASYNGKNYACCRRPYEIAGELCSSWKSYWRDNAGQCIVKRPLIVGGREAGIGQFPEMAILGEKVVSRSLKWICGGSLVSPHYVLTAAHCVVRKSEYVVRFGQHDMYMEDKTNISRVIGPVPLGLYKASEIHSENRNVAPVEQTIHVRKVILYPGYNSRYHGYNDVALLLLERPVVLTKRVLPACLPTDPDEDFMNLMLTVAGWGRTTYHSRTLSSTLRMLEVPVISSLQCAKSINNLNRYLIPKGILKSQICAGDEEKSFCSGDSGGPLVLQVRNKKSHVMCEHTIGGIVSFGPGCEKLNVYSRVSSYLDWITGYIAPKLVPKPVKHCEE